MIKTVSGSGVTIDDAVPGTPIKKLTVTMLPKQEGTGDPSPENVRSISGCTGVKLIRSGKNLINATGASTTISGVNFANNGDGTYTLNGTATANAGNYVTELMILPPGTYILTGCPTGQAQGVFLGLYNNASGSYGTMQDSGSGVTITLTEMLGVYVRIRIVTGATFDNVVFRPMLRPASETDSTFEPYSGETYEIAFPADPGTVYGGTLDVTTGVLTVTHKYIEFDGVTIGKKFSSKSGVANIYYVNIPDASNLGYSSNDYMSAQRLIAAGTLVTNLPIASIDTAVAPSFLGYNSVANGFSARVLFGENVTTVEEANTQLESWHSASTPLGLVYRLATPITYQLTPTEIEIFNGTMYSNADSIEVTYQSTSNEPVTVNRIDYSSLNLHDFGDTFINPISVNTSDEGE